MHIKQTIICGPTVIWSKEITNLFSFLIQKGYYKIRGALLKQFIAVFGNKDHHIFLLGRNVITLGKFLQYKLLCWSILLDTITEYFIRLLIFQLETLLGPADRLWSFKIFNLGFWILKLNLVKTAYATVSTCVCIV